MKTENFFKGLIDPVDLILGETLPGWRGRDIAGLERFHIELDLQSSFGSSDGAAFDHNTVLINLSGDFIRGTVLFLDGYCNDAIGS